ncbi:MAG: carboxypeptidase-like regulatory domain-containing protein [Longimicrobiales bacterium]
MKQSITLLIVLLALLPVTVQGQRLVGRVVESGTNTGIANVEIRLSNQDGPVGRVVSDSTGRFVLRVNTGGTYQLSTNHIGYGAVQSAIELTPGDQIEIVLRLSVAATPVAPIEVIARSRAPDAYLERNGFYDRKAEGFGVFQTREDIERRRPMVTTDMFQGLNGVRVFYQGIQGKDIRMTRGEDPNCPPRIIVDRVVVRRGGRASEANEQPLDMLLQPVNIQAIEIYRSPSETPLEFGGNQVTCGAVVFWTQRGSAR